MAHGRPKRTIDPGVTDTEIKIGQTIAYSGPASSFGTTGHTISAYYRMITDHGGVNGRKINFISADDGYTPPKTCDFWSWVMLTTGHYKCNPMAAHLKHPIELWFLRSGLPSFRGLS